MSDKTKVTRLKEELLQVPELDDEPPRVCGKTQHVVLTEYIEWLRRQMTKPKYTDEDRQVMQRRIDQLLQVQAERLRRGLD